MRIVVSIIVCVVLAATATAGGPAAIYPKDLDGGLHEWQSRASMHLVAECTGNKCDEYAIEPGTVYLLGTVVDYGRDTRVSRCFSPSGTTPG